MCLIISVHYTYVHSCSEFRHRLRHLCMVERHLQNISQSSTVLYFTFSVSVETVHTLPVPTHLMVFRKIVNYLWSPWAGRQELLIMSRNHPILQLSLATADHYSKPCTSPSLPLPHFHTCNTTNANDEPKVMKYCACEKVERGERSCVQGKPGASKCCSTPAQSPCWGVATVPVLWRQQPHFLDWPLRLRKWLTCCHDYHSSDQTPEPREGNQTESGHYVNH